MTCRTSRNTTRVPEALREWVLLYKERGFERLARWANPCIEDSPQTLLPSPHTTHHPLHIQIPRPHLYFTQKVCCKLNKNIPSLCINGVLSWPRLSSQLLLACETFFWHSRRIYLSARFPPNALFQRIRLFGWDQAQDTTFRNRWYNYRITTPKKALGTIAVLDST